MALRPGYVEWSAADRDSARMAAERFRIIGDDLDDEAELVGADLRPTRGRP